MSGSAPFALAPLSAAPVDPASLTLHLEICRLQAELELLERRIGDVQAAQGPPGDTDAAAPFAHRAEELVERMVASLRHAGREEIGAASESRRREAQAVLDHARRRAEDVVAGARGQLAAALVERSHVVDDALGVELEQVLLSDREGPPSAAALVVEMPVPPTPAMAPPAVGPTPAVEPRPQPESQPEARFQAHPVAKAIEAEEARTDAAFEAWLAVAPAAGAADPEPVVAVAAPVTEGRSRPRSRSLLPLEVLAALLATALVVVLVLVLVG